MMATIMVREKISLSGMDSNMTIVIKVIIDTLVIIHYI
jgi:hypothetical protein